MKYAPMLPTVKNGANGIFEFLFILPEYIPINANISPRREANPVATNNPGKPIKTPIRAANFTSPIPSFPFVIKRIPKRIKDPPSISNKILIMGSSKLKALNPNRTAIPGKTAQSGILFCLISSTQAGIEKIRNTAGKIINSKVLIITNTGGIVFLLQETVQKTQ